jgi:hypothetical protein
MGDGSVYKCAMGAGSKIWVQSHSSGGQRRGGGQLAKTRTSSNSPHPSVESDLLYLCDSEAALNKMSRWIGSGPRTTLAGDAKQYTT